MSPPLRRQRPPAHARLSWARGAGTGETGVSDPEMGPRSAEPTIILRPHARFGTLHPRPGARCTADGKALRAPTPWGGGCLWIRFPFFLESCFDFSYRGARFGNLEVGGVKKARLSPHA